MMEKTNKEVDPWNIPTLDLWDDESLLPFTIFDENHVFCSKQMIKLFPGHNNPAIPKQNFIPFKPHRLLLHELIIQFSILVPGHSEKEFQYAVTTIYQSGLKYYNDILSKLEKSYGCGQKVNNADQLDIITKEYLFAVSPTIVNLALILIDAYLVEKGIEAIAIPNPAMRITSLVCGGQASGKGSSIALLKRKMKEAGVDWKNVVRINTDSYKPLVLQPGTVSKYLYSQLSQPEASIIHSKLIERLTNLAIDNKAPHVIIDQVFVGSDKLKYAMINSGIAMIMVVSTDVITAVERSFARGELEIPPENGRYENTQGILRCHKNFAKDLPRTLSDFINSDIKIDIVDNNVEKGDAVIGTALIILGPEKEQQILIINELGMKNLIKKTYINENANSPLEVYPEGLDIQSSDIEQYFSPIGIKPIFESHQSISNTL